MLNNIITLTGHIGELPASLRDPENYVMREVALRMPTFPGHERVLLVEPGRVVRKHPESSGICYRAYTYVVTRGHVRDMVRVKHGAGEEWTEIDPAVTATILALSSDERFLLLHWVMRSRGEAARSSRQVEANRYAAAFVQGRLVTKKVRGNAQVTVHIEGLNLLNLRCRRVMTCIDGNQLESLFELSQFGGGRSPKVRDRTKAAKWTPDYPDGQTQRVEFEIYFEHVKRKKPARIPVGRVTLTGDQWRALESRDLGDDFIARAMAEVDNNAQPGPMLQDVSRAVSAMIDGCDVEKDRVDVAIHPAPMIEVAI
jgi:hypothetical protein